MNTIHFKAVLQSDVIFSERSATTGGHVTLNYIPGAAILGLCAGHLYEELGDDASYVFHSGHVRFGNGYPIYSQNYPTIPIPLAWHTEKGERAYSDDGKLEIQNIRNMLHFTANKEKEWQKKQPKQIREGYFALNGYYMEPLTFYRIKTAIDRDKGGRPEESALFGYESLAADTTYYFSIDFDDEVKQNVQKRIKEVLTEKLHRIGKSRKAEYGMVVITEVKDITAGNDPVPNDKNISIYCLSDIALRNPSTGSPSMVPLPSHFHVDDSCLFMPENSFIRTRKYSPFNRTRKSHDLERQVICKGSVITFCRPQSLSKDDLVVLQKKLNCGVGMYRQDGFGKVFVNPAFLSGWQFVPVNHLEALADVKPAVNKTDFSNEQETNKLICWLQDQDEYSNMEKTAIEQVEKWVSPLIEEGIKKLKSKAPGKSQWGQLRDVAIKAKEYEDFERLLLTGVKAVCASGVSKRKWEEKFYFKDVNKRISFSEFIKDQVLKSGEKKQDKLFFTRQLLYRLGNRMPHAMNQEEL